VPAFSDQGERRPEDWVRVAKDSVAIGIDLAHPRARVDVLKKAKKDGNI